MDWRALKGIIAWAESGASCIYKTPSEIAARRGMGYPTCICILYLQNSPLWFQQSLGHFKCHFHTSIAPSLRAVCSASCPFHQVLCPFVLHCMCMRSNLSLSCLSLVQPTADAFSVCSQTSQMLFRRVLKSFQLNHIYINSTYIYLVWRCFEVELKPTLFRIPYPSQRRGFWHWGLWTLRKIAGMFFWTIALVTMKLSAQTLGCSVSFRSIKYPLPCSL